MELIRPFHDRLDARVAFSDRNFPRAQIMSSQGELPFEIGDCAIELLIGNTRHVPEAKSFSGELRQGFHGRDVLHKRVRQPSRSSMSTLSV